MVINGDIYIYIVTYSDIYCLVVEKWWSSSIGMMIIPNINGNMPKMATKPPTSSRFIRKTPHFWSVSCIKSICAPSKKKTSEFYGIHQRDMLWHIEMGTLQLSVSIFPEELCCWGCWVSTLVPLASLYWDPPTPVLLGGVCQPQLLSQHFVCLWNLVDTKACQSHCQAFVAL